MSQQTRGVRARKRGYKYERKLADRIDGMENWTAWRLGAPQIQLPDILAISYDEVYAIECKSTVSKNECTIPYHQAIMCYNLAETFGRYPIRMAVGAVSFPNATQNRKNIEYMFELPIVPGCDIVCTKSGKIYTLEDDGEHSKRVRVEREFVGVEF